MDDPRERLHQQYKIAQQRDLAKKLGLSDKFVRIVATKELPIDNRQLHKKSTKKRKAAKLARRNNRKK